MGFPSYFTYLKDKNITWFNPCWGYDGFWKRINEFQKDRRIDFGAAWSHKDMKRNKELYATSLVALCMQHDVPTKRGWWFTKPPQDPPDGLIGTPIEDEVGGGNIMHGREVEVVEHFGGSLLDTIKNKLGNKSYEPNTILVCLLSPQDNVSIFDFKSISEQIRSISLPLAHIFLVGHGFQITFKFRDLSREEKIEEMSKVLLVQLLPKYAMVNISPDSSCKSYREGKEQAWLKFTKIGKGVDFQQVTLKSAPKLFD